MSKITVITFSLLMFVSACSSSSSSNETLLKQQKKLSKQEESLLKKLEANKTADTFADLARFYMKENRKNDAFKAYDNALIRDSLRSDIRFEFAEYAYSQNEKRLALMQFKEILLLPGASQFTDGIASYFFSYKNTRLTNNQFSSAFPTFNHDGTRIFFQTDVNGSWDIASMNLDGEDIQFHINSNANEERPSVSSDGRFLAYTSDEEDTRIIDAAQKWRELYLLTFKTKKTEQLTRNYCDDYYPRFVKNKSELIFVSERADTRNLPYGERFTNVFVMNYDGSFQIPLTKGEFFDNSGVYVEKAVYTLFSSKRDSLNKEFYELFKVNNNTKEIELFMKKDFNLISVDATEDAKKILFTGDKGGNFDIYMTDRYGQKMERLTSDESFEDQAQFSPDGKMIIYHSSDGIFFQLNIIRLDSRSEEPSIDNLLRRINSEL